MAIDLKIAHRLLRSLPEFATGERFRYYSLDSKEFANYIEILPPEQREPGKGKTRKGPHPLSEDQFLHMANAAVTIHQFEQMYRRHIFDGHPFERQVPVEELSAQQMAQVKATLEMLLAEQRTTHDPRMLKDIEEAAYERARKELLAGKLPGLEELTKNRKPPGNATRTKKGMVRKAEYERRAKLIGFPIPDRWTWGAIQKMNAKYALWEINHMADKAMDDENTKKDRLAPTSPDQLPSEPVEAAESV